MACFTDERIAEFRAGSQLTEEEDNHTWQCDNCCEAWLANGQPVESKPSLVWDDSTQQWLPNR